jgi:hypothetical protein
MPLAPGGGFDFSAEVSPKMKLLDDGLYHVIPYSDCHHIANISLYIYIYVYYIILYIYHILLYILIFIVLPTDVGAFFGHLSRLNHSFSMVELQDQDQQEHALATQKFSKK